MIPTLVLVGVVLGRWWRTTLLVVAVGWPAALAATDALPAGGLPDLLFAAALGVANAGLGIAVHRFVLRLVRRGAHAAGDRG